jgi:hypothetical protein
VNALQQHRRSGCLCELQVENEIRGDVLAESGKGGQSLRRSSAALLTLPDVSHVTQLDISTSLRLKGMGVTMDM